MINILEIIEQESWKYNSQESCKIMEGQSQELIMKEEMQRRTSKEEIGRRIKEARENKGLKSGELAIMCGWEDTKSRISNYERGISAPSYSDMAKIGEVLGVNSAWLAFGDISKPPEPASADESECELIGAEIEPWDSSTPLSSDEIAVNFFIDVEAAAGNGNLVHLENHGPKLRFSKSTLRRAGVDPESAVCIKVSGNSMEPIIPDGAVIGVDTASKTVKDGEVYVVKQGEVLRVKMLSRLPGGYRLKSYNPDYEPEIIEGDEAKDLNIVGWVFWWSVLRYRK